MEKIKSFSRTKKFIALFTAVILFVTSFLIAGIFPAKETSAATPATSTEGAYLFAYFTSDSQYGQRIRFAVSNDGYNYQPLNFNKPIITQTKGTLNCRDPYIFKGHDDYYYLICTDMDASASKWWDNSNSMVIWRSKDLVNWTDETIIDLSQMDWFKGSTVHRCWAPQVIWDDSTNKYMVYFALADDSHTNSVTTLYYMLTDNLLDSASYGEPQLLYMSPSGKNSIDGDIIYDAKSGTYYLYYKDESEATICYVTSKELKSGYSTNPVKAVNSDVGLEGCNSYFINGTDTLVMLADAYGEGYFVINQSTDFKNFETLTSDQYTINNCSPRHGSVVNISDDQYNQLVATYGISNEDNILYTFDEDISENTWWSYTTKTDSCGHEYTYCVDGNSGSGDNGNIKISNGVVDLYKSNLFINDVGVRNLIMDQNAFSISVKHKLTADTPLNSSTPNYRNTGIILSVSNYNIDFVSLKEDGTFTVYDTAKKEYVTSDVKAPVATGTEAKYTVSNNGTSVSLYINDVLVSTIDATVVPASGQDNSGNFSFFIGLGYSDVASRTSECKRICGTYSELSISTNPVEDDLDSMYSSALNGFETMLKNAPSVYSNSLEAYNAYLKVKEYYDSYTYGETDTVTAEVVEAKIADLGKKIANMAEVTISANATGSFSGDSKYVTAWNYRENYQNLLLSGAVGGSDVCVNTGTIKTSTGLAGAYCGQKMFISHPVTVMLYDGKTAPTMPVLMESEAVSSWNWSNNARIYSSWINNTELKFVNGNWNGTGYTKDFMWIIRNGTSYCGTVYGATDPFIGDNDDCFMTNMLTVNESAISSTDYSKAINLSWGFTIGTDDKDPVTANNYNDSNPVYIINYKSLLDKYQKAMSLLSDASKYDVDFENVRNLLSVCDNTVAAVNPGTVDYSQDTANRVSSMGDSIKNAVEQLENAKSKLLADDGSAYQSLRDAIVSSPIKENTDCYSADTWNAYITARNNALNAINNVVSQDYVLSFNGQTIDSIASTLNSTRGALTQEHPYLFDSYFDDNGTQKALYVCENNSDHTTTADVDAYLALASVYASIDLNKYDEDGTSALEEVKAEYDTAVDTSTPISDPQTNIDEEIRALLSEIGTQNVEGLATFTVTYHVNGVQDKIVNDVHYNEPYTFTYTPNDGEVVTEWKLVRNGVETVVNSSENSIQFSVSGDADLYITTAKSSEATSDVLVEGQRNGKNFAAGYVPVGEKITVNGNKLLVGENVLMTAPRVPFYSDVTYWDINGEKFTNGSTYAVNSNDTVIAVPHYNLLNTYTVSIASGTDGTITTYRNDETDETGNSVTASFDQKMLLSTTENDFYAWALVVGDSYEIVSYEKDYNFFCEGTATYKVIKTSDEHDEYLPYVRIRNASMATGDVGSINGCFIKNPDPVDGKYRISIISQVVQNKNDDKYTVTDCGVIVSTTPIEINNFEIGSDGVRKLSSASQTVAGQYSTTCSKSDSMFNYLTARAYVTYTYNYNGENITVTTYSNPVVVG